MGVGHADGFVNGRLGGLDRQGGVLRNGFSERPRGRLELALRDKPLHDTEAMGLLGVDASCREEQVFRRGCADRSRDKPHGAWRIPDAQPRRRNAEDGAVGCYPQIAGQGEAEAAAEAEASNHGDDGLGAMSDRPECRLVGGLIEASALGIGPHRRELGYVRTRDEGILTCAPQDDHPDLRVPVESRHERREGPPHLQVHSVVLGQVVDRDRCDAAG